MSDLEIALRKIIADVVREELRAVFPHPTPRLSPDAGPRYVSPMQAATIASASPTAVRIWIRQGQLRAFQAGRLIRISLDDLHALLVPKSYEPHVSEEEADQAVESWHKENRTRCPECGPLPMWHARGVCRAKHCTCKRRMK